MKMTDPKQARILSKLGLLWAQQPDLRLGQLLVNLQPHEVTGITGFYNISDDRLEQFIDDRLDAIFKQGDI